MIQGKPIPASEVYWAWLRICAIVALGTGWFSEYKKLRGMVANRPVLKVPPSGCYVDSRPFTWQREAQNVSCLHLRIVNDPRIPTEHGNAVGIGATITFFDSDDVCLFFFDARWGDSTQPSFLERGESTFTLLNVDLPIGRTREIDIAIKTATDDNCYGFNNDSYHANHFLHPRWKLVGERFKAVVRVRGAFVDYAWEVRFRNPGKGLEFEVESCKEVKPSSPF